MELSYIVKQRIEEELSDIPFKALSASSEKITAAYKSDRKEGKNLVSERIDTLTYSAVRMPATFGAASFALNQIKQLYNENICTLLDVGAGTGAVSWAAAEIFDELENVVCAEREQNMIDIGNMLMTDCDFPCEFNWIKTDLNSINSLPPADIVTASYVTNEMNEKSRKDLIEKLWLSAQKVLLIIEPGTLEGFSIIKNIRNQLIKLGAYIIAPCPGIELCPLPDNDWCHFTERVPRSKLHKQIKDGSVPYEDEKFCYIAAAKNAVSPCKARILRHPKIESGKISLKLCTSDGITEKIITKRDSSFKAARKSECGESFDIL